MSSFWPGSFVFRRVCIVHALVTLVALLLDVSLADPSPYNWSLFVGVGTTLVLWLTALPITRLGLRVMRHRA
jgi:hypothetical protein